MNKKILAVIFSAVCAAASVGAYDPVSAASVYSLPASAGSVAGGSSAGGGILNPVQPAAAEVNPALLASEQRIVFDISGGALFNFGSDAGLAGGNVRLGIAWPFRNWGVAYAGLGFLSSSAEAVLDAKDTTRAGMFLNFGFAKPVFDDWYLGLGFHGFAGKDDATGLFINETAGNIGILNIPGTVAFLKDLRWGVALTGMGAMLGSSDAAINAPFTLRGGAAAILLRTESVKLGASVDIALPSFYKNAVFGAALQFSVKELISLSVGWDFNVVEFSDRKTVHYPSATLAVNFKISQADEQSFLAKNNWNNSDLSVSPYFRNIYGDIWSAGVSANAFMGVKDTKAPEYDIQYPAAVSFSPNNDGVQDDLVFDMKILDDRIITGWAFIIEDGNGNVIRTIANKEKRPETGLKKLQAFFKNIVRPKEGVVLPDSIRWDGTAETGEIAADGVYYFRLEAIDDNGNESKSPVYEVEIDNTVPSIMIEEKVDAVTEITRKPSELIFSPDGDGNKDTFVIPQKGSAEPEWKGVFYSAAGTAVRTYTWTNAKPENVAWDGRDDNGVIVPDGVYYYIITATDKAGNKAAARISNIIVNTEKPAIALSISTNYFSPDNNGVKDTVRITPSVPVTSGMTGWTLDITGADGTAVKTLTGTKAAPTALDFDGKDSNGAPLPEGGYQATLSVTYENGYHPVAKSPVFTIDVTAPSAEVAAKSGNVVNGAVIFSPNGDGKMDSLGITLKGSAEDLWTAEIKNAAGKVVKTFAYTGSLPAEMSWDGIREDGSLADDDAYTLVVSAVDKAGNKGASKPLPFALSTENAQVILHANRKAFSPNGDKSADTIAFNPTLNSKTAVASYTLSVNDAAGKPVRTWSGNNAVPASFIWDGMLSDGTTQAPDGYYTAVIEIVYVNGNTSKSATPAFELDRVFPSIDVSAPYTVFSPNGDLNKDTLIVSQKTAGSDDWTAAVTDSKNKTVRRWTWQKAAADIAWDGCDDDGNPVADGTYTYTVSAEDAAGNVTVKKVAPIVLDKRIPKVYITPALSGISPNGNGIKEKQTFAIMTSIPDGIESWKLSVIPENGKEPVFVREGGENSVIPGSVEWDGKTAGGKPAHGSFTAQLAVSYIKGDRVQTVTSPFVVNAEPPKLSVKLSPRYFSPDNDGVDDELFIDLSAQSISPFAEWSFAVYEPEGSAKPFWKASGNGSITERIIWDGRSAKGELVQAATDYPYIFTVKDDLGNSSTVQGYIPVDVLVIRDGANLKIQVPSIIFRQDHADFIGLPDDMVKKNNAVLKRIAEILNKFKDYRVTIEGHANNVTGTQREEDEELLPLSQLRAEAIKEILKKNGVAESRLSTIGMGGTKPVVSRTDKENRWKNRRVEFILNK